MPKLAALRHRAATLQHFRCHYCGYPMWERDPAELQLLAPLSARAAADLKCTAEHLVARCDGGRDVAHNIVAACLRCNRTRHKAKNPLPAEKFKKRVVRRMAAGRWWPASHVLRWTHEIAQRPAVRRGCMVNRTSGDPAEQLHERHDASDFELRTQDKLDAGGGGGSGN